MEKPKPEQIAISEEMFYLKEKIIIGYAQVEFFLADLAVKLNLKFPYLVEAVKVIADRPDYAEFRNELKSVTSFSSTMTRDTSSERRLN